MWHCHPVPNPSTAKRKPIMTSIEILPMIALVAMFVVASIFPINIGILGFIGAFVLGAFALGYDDKEILAEFPTSIVLTIVGVTYFFGMAKKNGTIDLLVNACIRAVRGRVTVVPWVFFFAASVLTALGTFSPAAVALIAPAAMAFAARTRMSPLVMGIMTINGAHAGAFSPISVSGVLVTDIVNSSGLTIAPWTLFFASYGINLLLSVLTVVGYSVLARVRDLEYTATGTSDGTVGAPKNPTGGTAPDWAPAGGAGGSGGTQVLTRERRSTSGVPDADPVTA